MKHAKLIKTVGMFGMSVLLAGCATTITKPASAPQPAKERLGTFKAVEFEHVVIAPKFAPAAANKKAAKKIEEELVMGLVNVFPGMKLVAKAEGDTSVKTLVIRPVIKEIKFVGGAARFWVGAMAGSSAVLMQVDYLDKASGATVASAEFYRVGNAWGGGVSMGGSDNMMLSQIAQDVLNYTVSNR